MPLLFRNVIRCGAGLLRRLNALSGYVNQEYRITRSGKIAAKRHGIPAMAGP
jgi:hypothetical protein